MPTYIASGKDKFSESSVKVSAQTDDEAFALAKQRLPLVLGLERIEPDGILVRITNQPFDDPKQAPQPDANEDHYQKRHKIQRANKPFVLLLWVMIIAIGWRAISYALFHSTPRLFQLFQPAPQTPSDPPPASAPQK